MSKEKIEIEVPVGYTAKFNPETMKVEIIKEDTKPKTWKEFCANFPCKEDEVYISSDSMIMSRSDLTNDLSRACYYDKNLCTSKEEAEAFLALMQLRQLRKAWVGDWEPDYSRSRYGTFSIRRHNDEQEFRILNEDITGALVFPTREMAEEFLECFRHLIEKAKILL